MPARKSRQFRGKPLAGGAAPATRDASPLDPYGRGGKTGADLDGRRLDGPRRRAAQYESALTTSP
jgi:hypothetical protein